MICRNPYSGERIGEISSTPIKSVGSLEENARVAMEKNRSLSLDERLCWMKRFRDLFQEKQELLAQIQSNETGKPISQALGEVKATVERIQYFIDNVPTLLEAREVRTSGNTKEVLSYDPLGVVAVISAWNYPYFVGINVLVPALLAGNAVLYKPSEYAALVGEQIAQLMQEAEVPDGLFTIFQGEGSLAEEILSQNIDGVFFTGSNETGMKIVESMAKRLIPLGLELGGKDPCYVSDSNTDVAKVAAAVADGAFYNGGQSCCAVERVYVHEAVYDEFLQEFIKAVQGFKVGDPSEKDTYFGPLTRPLHTEILKSQLNDALSLGAKLALGGDLSQVPEGYFPPTVLTDVNHDMEVMKEETFGPLVGIQKVKSADEALVLMQDTKFGLTASVFSDHEQQARDILSCIEAGNVYWNCCDRVSPYLPWSGRQGSGLGSTLGHKGIMAMVQPKSWHFRSPCS